MSTISSSEIIQLHPTLVATSVTSALPNNTSPSLAAVATVLLRTSLEFRFTYLRDQDSYRDMQKQMGAGIQTCDFIKDVRSTNVLDVLGSVGGLFAILQSAHVILFGRPLLWGLTGSKVP